MRSAGKLPSMAEMSPYKSAKKTKKNFSIKPIGVSKNFQKQNSTVIPKTAVIGGVKNLFDKAEKKKFTLSFPEGFYPV